MGGNVSIVSLESFCHTLSFVTVFCFSFPREISLQKNKGVELFFGRIFFTESFPRWLCFSFSSFPIDKLSLFKSYLVNRFIALMTPGVVPIALSDLNPRIFFFCCFVTWHVGVRRQLGTCLLDVIFLFSFKSLSLFLRRIKHRIHVILLFLLLIHRTLCI